VQAYESDSRRDRVEPDPCCASVIAKKVDF